MNRSLRKGSSQDIPLYRPSTRMSRCWSTALNVYERLQELKMLSRSALALLVAEHGVREDLVDSGLDRRRRLDAPLSDTFDEEVFHPSKNRPSSLCWSGRVSACMAGKRDYTGLSHYVQRGRGALEGAARRSEASHGAAAPESRV
jgi:hypothetical protein